ncbi:hypothetical protein QJR26_04410 [Clostridium baratii]
MFIILVIILEWILEYLFFKYIREELKDIEFLLGMLPAMIIGLDLLISIFQKGILEILPFHLNNITLGSLNFINVIKIIRLKKRKPQKGINLIIYLRIIYSLIITIILIQKIM